MKSKPIIIGILGSLGLSVLYILLLILIGGFISDLWIWLLVLVAGFGIQFGLYHFVRSNNKSKSITAEASTTMGITTGSMIACCLHLAVGFLPLVGLSAFTLALASYQTQFLLLGVLSNTLGVLFMLSKIKKHNLVSNKFMVNKINYKALSIFVVIIGLSSMTTTLFAIEHNYFNQEFEEQVLKNRRVTFSVKPEIDKDINIFISMNTHSVDLDFDMVEIGFLLDAKGNKIEPVSWDGPGKGGHHRSGKLMFNYNNYSTLIFVLNPGGKFKELEFTWDIK